MRIYDDEEYEKNEVFYIEMDEPRLIRRGSGEGLDLMILKNYDIHVYRINYIQKSLVFVGSLNSIIIHSCII